jgi:D-2-hydroxyacid dehydrogenase (NADP+)
MSNNMSPPVTDVKSSEFPKIDDLTVCFAHPAYLLQDRFVKRFPNVRSYQVKTVEALEEKIKDVDVLVVSGLWRNKFVEAAPKLRYIQSISAGMDQYDKALLKNAGVHLASGQGANERAVAEHAMSLILALTRRLHEARDNQAEKKWRGMIADLDLREDELSGKTMLIVGFGRIGRRLGSFAKSFGINVIGMKNTPGTALGGETVVTPDKLASILPAVDIVALTCPLTDQTRGLINSEALSLMKANAILINVARGPVVDEAALIAVLEKGHLAGVGLDCFTEEPLSENSPLWSYKRVIVTPHSAGETRKYEVNIIDILEENISRLTNGQSELVNQAV